LSGTGTLEENPPAAAQPAAKVDADSVIAPESSLEVAQSAANEFQLPADQKWPRSGRMLFILGSSLLLWLFVLIALFWL
jgi:hypothetical protein